MTARFSTPQKTRLNGLADGATLGRFREAPIRYSASTSMFILDDNDVGPSVRARLGTLKSEAMPIMSLGTKAADRVERGIPETLHEARVNARPSFC
jgi:hypothetical protein